MYISISKFIDMVMKVLDDNDTNLIAKMRLSGFDIISITDYDTTFYHPQFKGYSIQCIRPVSDKSIFLFSYGALTFSTYINDDVYYHDVYIRENNIIRGSTHDLVQHINQSLLDLSNEELIFRNRGISYYIGKSKTGYECISMVVKGIRDKDKEVVFLLPIEGGTAKYLDCSYDNGILDLKVSDKGDNRNLVTATVGINLYKGYGITVKKVESTLLCESTSIV